MRSPWTWPLRLAWFCLWFFWEQTKTSAIVLRDALLPHSHFEPGFILFHTHCRSDFEVTLLSALITLTPGTLTLGAQRADGSEHWEIAVHGMHFPSPEDLVEALHEMEDHMLRAIRKEGFAR